MVVHVLHVKSATYLDYLDYLFPFGTGRSTNQLIQFDNSRSDRSAILRPSMCDDCGWDLSRLLHTNHPSLGSPPPQWLRSTFLTEVPGSTSHAVSTCTGRWFCVLFAGDHKRFLESLEAVKCYREVYQEEQGGVIGRRGVAIRSLSDLLSLFSLCSFFVN